MRNAIIFIVSVLGLSSRAMGGAVTYSLIYDGPLTIDADRTVTM